MNMRIMLAGCLALLAATGVHGQTKIGGTLKCDKPEPAYRIEVGDRPGHVMVLEKQTCSWTQPLSLGSDKTKEGTSVATVDVSESRANGSGIHIDTTEGGDKVFVSYRYTTVVKGGKAAGADGKWSYTGGTGKLKGIKGSGTFKTTFAEDGTSTTEVEGEYTLPEGGPGKKKE